MTDTAPSGMTPKPASAGGPASTRIGEFDRDAYRRAARLVLRHPLVTPTFPDVNALPLIRRWAVPLAEDLNELLGYRLELTATTARLIRIHDELDGTRPAVTRTGREFDRRRYAYLVLTLAVIDRSGSQVALSELADRVSGETTQVDGLELTPERAADRGAFVDVVGWLTERGALTIADGSARGWAEDPGSGEALYDIDRDIARAIYRPSRVLQHVSGVAELLGGVGHTGSTGSTGGIDNSDRGSDSGAAEEPSAGRTTLRRRAAQRVRRGLVEKPVVYYDDLDPSLHGMLRSPRTATGLAEFTGAPVERRSDGAMLLDVAGGLTDRRFPGPGTVSQVALLLVVEICDRIEDVDAPALPRFPRPPSVSSALAAELDAALPRSSAFHIEGATPRTASYLEPLDRDDGPSRDDETDVDYPFLDQSWLDQVIRDIAERYGTSFAAKWRADLPGLLHAALTVLVELHMVARTSGGIVILPLIARYRNAVVDVRPRDSAGEGLFSV